MENTLYKKLKEDIVICDNVFVYGTLKNGESNHRWIEDNRYIGNGITVNKYKMVGGVGFPYILDDEILNGKHNIHGEVYNIIGVENLNMLDILEGYPDLYTRKIIDIKLNNNTGMYNRGDNLGKDNIKEEVIKCWVYMLNKTDSACMKGEDGIEEWHMKTEYNLT